MGNMVLQTLLGRQDSKAQMASVILLGYWDGLIRVPGSGMDNVSAMSRENLQNQHV
jgi:hypothetical protein